MDLLQSGYHRCLPRKKVERQIKFRISRARRIFTSGFAEERLPAQTNSRYAGCCVIYQPDRKGARTMLTSALGKGTTFPMGWAILLIVVGFFALALPFEAGIAIAIVIAVLVIVAGIAHLAGTFAARTTGGFFWRLLVGCAYLIAGVYLLVNPKLSLVSLTLALAVLFFVEAIFHIVTYFQIRSAPGSGWLLFDGIVTLILAIMIWRSWPASAVWALGTIVGINLLMSGFTRLMYSRAVKANL
jgi:uncharacterized membrane protein HdeD (DUF308 family)